MKNLLSGLKKLSFSKVFMIVSVIIILFLLYKLRNPNPTQVFAKHESNVLDEAKVEAKKLSEQVDKKGFSKATFERKDAIIGNGDLSGLPISRAVFDSLRLDNIEKGRKLQEASVINATLNANGLRATKLIDSLQNEYYFYSDPFATVKFTRDSLGGKFDLGYNIKLIKHNYKNRKNFFSPFTQYTDILAPDKRITIDGLQSLTFSSQKQSRIGFGLQLGYYYDPIRNNFFPAAGVGLSYNLKNF
ncbi:MAG: hypothetical protein V4663_05985 [Bacteroidota bacterium]